MHNSSRVIFKVSASFKAFDTMQSSHFIDYSPVCMNGEIFDVIFGLYAKEDITAADGTIISANGLIELVSMDADGHGICKTDLPFGSYYVKELSTNAAYLPSDKTYPVIFEYAGQNTAFVKLTANDGNPIDNNLLRGTVNGIKKDEDSKGLGGAVMGLFKADTTEFTAENSILTATSKDDGSFSFADVPYGNYIVREIESPTGFVLSETLSPLPLIRTEPLLRWSLPTPVFVAMLL